MKKRLDKTTYSRLLREKGLDDSEIQKILTNLSKQGVWRNENL